MVQVPSSKRLRQGAQALPGGTALVTQTGQSLPPRSLRRGTASSSAAQIAQVERQPHGRLIIFLLAIQLRLLGQSHEVHIQSSHSADRDPLCLRHP